MNPRPLRFLRRAAHEKLKRKKTTLGLMRRSHHREIRSSAKVIAVRRLEYKGFKDVGPGERRASLLNAGIEGCVGETMSRMKISQLCTVVSVRWHGCPRLVVSMAGSGKFA